MTNQVSNSNINLNLPQRENILWSGSPTQLTNLHHYIVSIILVSIFVLYFIFTNNSIVLYALAIPFLTSFWAWLNINQTKYVLTNERIVKKYGILNRHTFDVELYRVKDVHLKEPLLLRIFKFGTIRLITSQQSTENFIILGIKKSKELREHIRKLVEERRIQKGVREFDTN